jgi:hypothetical protein
VGAYASAALVVAASLVLGRAILALSGRGESTLLAGPVGLAAVLTVSGIAIHLPGRATAVAVSLTLLTLVSACCLWWRGGPHRVVPGVAPAIAAAALALLAASIPFAVTGRVGILGVGLVNDDMASHLAIADWLWTHVGQEPGIIGQGYPLGPHALAAGLASGLGTGLVEAFAGIVLAVPVLTALTAAGVLAELRPVPRAIAAALVALPYLAAAYLAQEAFKEPIEALFVLGFAVLLPATRSPRDAIALGVLAAGAVYVYSFPGLGWLAGTAVIYALWARRRPWAVAAGVLAVLLLLTAADWGRIADFTDFRAFGSSSISEGLGNLRHHLSPLEALGIWPTSEFRLSAADSSHTLAFYAGALVAATALALGLPSWLRRHGPAVPAALAAALAAYLGALALGTVYTSAKALAIASPLILLVSLGGLLDRGGGGRATRLLALALIAGAAFSSFLVLRQAPVAPDDHRSQLAELRPLVQGQRVLFLGRDNFVAWELRGARPFVAVRNYYDRDYVKPNVALVDIFRKFDFDSVRPETLNRFRYVITTRAAYASGPPAAFAPLRATDDFVLWRRTGPVGARRTLAEGAAPGTALECKGGDRARGVATVFRRRPVAGGAWSPSPIVEGGATATQSLRLRPGRWEVSLQYDATQPIHVTAPGLDATLPANLDYRGSVPYFPAGRLTVPRSGEVRFDVTVERPPLVGRVLGTKSVAHLGAIALSPAGSHGPFPGEAEVRLPLAHACGRYLDWYRPR